MLPNWDYSALKTEYIEHLQNLIRIDTVNPPGNEIAAVRYLAGILDEEGIDYTVLESAPGRGSIVARLKGDGSKRPLLMMSHLDVVGFESDKWRYDPLGGEITEGCVWGRGSLDCKNSVALWLMVMLAFKRNGLVPKRDLIFLANADEESGGRYGLEWIVNNHWDLIDAETALNEGGGFGIEFLNQTYFTYQNAEKGNIWLRIKAKGTPGHASVPLSDNPTLRVGELIHKLNSVRFPVNVTETMRRMIMTMAESQRFPVNVVLPYLLNPVFSEAIIKLGIKDDAVAGSFRSMLRNTICPTVIRAGQKVNVIPSEAALEIDYRVLPGHTIAEELNLIRKKIGKDFEVEILDMQPPSESPIDNELVNSIRRGLARHAGDAHLVPLLLPGVTDGVFLRQKGVAVYGFTPVLAHDEIDLAHSHNERISLESLEFAVKLGLDVVVDYVM